VSTFDEAENFCSSQPVSPSKMLTSPCLSTFGEGKHLRREWSEVEEERAAIAEHDGRIPRTWAEGLARLNPNLPPGDVPPPRWQRFIDDVGIFLEIA
jgi:hypothetical protein